MGVIAKLSKETTEDSLWELFKDCGTISAVKLVKDRETWESRGIAFIDFEQTEATDAAVKMTGQRVDNWDVSSQKKRRVVCSCLVWGTF